MENEAGKDLGLFDDTYTYSMLVVTSQNDQNINSDFGGIDSTLDGYDASIPFTQQPVDTDGDGVPDSIGGGLSQPVDPGGAVVPEPATYALLFGFLTLGYVASRRRR